MINKHKQIFVFRQEVLKDVKKLKEEYSNRTPISLMTLLNCAIITSRTKNTQSHGTGTVYATAEQQEEMERRLLNIKKTADSNNNTDQIGINFDSMLLL
jgi:hypothetical protein